MILPLHALIALVLSPFATSVENREVVDSTLAVLSYATYQGRTLPEFPSSVAFLGLPYAEPPLRYRAPEHLNTVRVSQEAGNKTIDATVYPDFCVQGATSSNDRGGAGSEDCLKVNVYRPVGVGLGDQLPVLVYFHGGGYVFGNPANWPFDHWIQQSPNVIIVSVYYRLDSFGFLSHPSSLAADLNVGFKDQVQALHWVQSNIRDFGGNPGLVTINGESAGGASVENHLVANEGGQETRLFTQAIAQSVYRTPVPLPQDQVPLFNNFVSLAGCTADGSFDGQIACLRNASVSTLAIAQDAASRSTSSGSLYRSFHPVVDGQLITDHPTKLLLQGQFTRVPLIVGATANETLGTTSPIVSNIISSLQSYFPGLPTADINALIAKYPREEFSSDAEWARTTTGDATVRCGRSILANTYAAKGLPTYAYRYSQPNPTQSDNITEHAAENWMMFLGTNTGSNGTTTFTPFSPAEQAFASEVIAYWLSFVRAGDPNVYKLNSSAVWDAYDKNRIVLQEAGSFVEPEPVEETERCSFVAGLVGTQA